MPDRTTTGKVPPQVRGARPVALITGVGRQRGLGAAIAMALAQDGWDIAATHWSNYDASMPWHSDADGLAAVASSVQATGARWLLLERDLGDPATPAELFDEVETAIGSVTGLVVNHTHCVTSSLLDTSIESFDRHYAVNVRATWLLLQEFGTRFRSEAGTGRIVTLTSDHTSPGNVPYGVTKGAADRLTDAAAYEFGHLGVTANAVNPGPTDTGWMTDDDRAHATSATALPRAGQPDDVANIIAFLFSERGGWITGQLLYSNGGFKGTIG